MDPIEEWKQAQQRVGRLVGEASPEAIERKVPACPDWTVRELLSHMIGLDADTLAGDEPEDHNPDWTQRHVDQRRDSDIPALLKEWDELTGPLTTWMRDNDPRPLGDALIHEQDLRGALGVPGARDTAGLASIRDTFTGRFRDAVGDRPPIALAGDTWQWASSGEVADAPVRLRASDFDLTRAMMSRRSAAQLHSWTDRGDVTPYLDAFGLLGDLPTEDLTD